MKLKDEFLKRCGIKEGEEHHIKQARQDYNCNYCNCLIPKGDFYYAVLSTLPIGYRRIANVTIARLHISCARTDKSGYATKDDFNE